MLAALRELERRGVPLLVATGRRLASTRAPLAAIGLAPAAVVLNGALGVELATGERFHRAAYPTAEAVAVLDAVPIGGPRPGRVRRPSAVRRVPVPHPSTNPAHVAALGDTAGVDDLARVVAEEVVLGFGMIGVPHADGVAAKEAVGDLAEVHLDRSIDFGGYASLTVAPRGPVEVGWRPRVLRRRGLRSDRVLAVADGPNDLELLANAAVSAVPIVAHPAALERADHVIASAADGGWADILALLD